jgi:hypothetical protein
MIKSTPDSPSWLCHTAPYERFVSEVENIIWYQAIYTRLDGSVDLEREFEDIPLSLLGDLERWDVRHRAKQIAQARESGRTLRETDEPVPLERKRKRAIPISEVGSGTSLLGLPLVSGDMQQGQMMGNNPTLSKMKRFYLFYTSKEKSEDHEPSSMSPLQSFLWSLISQALLWKPSSMSRYIDWKGVVDPQTSRLYRIPEVSELKVFLRTLISVTGSPVVITICRADKLLHDVGSEPIQFLASLCNDTVALGVRVFLIISTFDRSSTLPGIKSSQALNRHTEHDGQWTRAPGFTYTC